MTPLTEHQFHTVWTNAVGMDGYDKQLFRNLLQKMKASGEIVDEEPVPLMKILSAELVQTNIRDRIPGGVHITFLTSDTVKKDDYFTMPLNGKGYEFQVIGIEVEGNDLLKIKAVEVGYYATRLDRTGIDLRNVIGCDLFLVTDDKVKAGIYERSCWC